MSVVKLFLCFQLFCLLFVSSSLRAATAEAIGSFLKEINPNTDRTEKRRTLREALQSIRSQFALQEELKEDHDYWKNLSKEEQVFLENSIQSLKDQERLFRKELRELAEQSANKRILGRALGNIRRKKPPQ